jgi:hypothetical protein
MSLAALLAFWNGNSVIILSTLLIISESLAAIPSIKSNAIYQLLLNILITITKKNK